MTARPITSTSALGALRRTADALGVDPRHLTVVAYRRHRTATGAGVELPSHLAISLLFGGWQRACELAAVQPLRPAGAESTVRHRLDGGSHAEERVQRVV